MERTYWMALAALGTGALLATAACDSEDDGDGGGGATATGTTTAGGGGGGTCSCMPCADYIIACTTECPAGDPRDVICEASLPVMGAVNDCICDAARGNCEADCPTTCAMDIGGGGAAQGGAPAADTSDCVPCQGEAITDVCKTEFDACAALRNCT